MTGRAHQKPRARLSPLGVAFIASALLHLSMVTLFSVVIYFPRQDIDYYQFQIRQVPSDAPATPRGAGQLRGPSLDDAMAEVLGPSDASASAARLPSIQLPTLEFAELSRLRVGRDSGLDYGALLDDGPDDSWARFSSGLRRLGESITSLTAPEEDTISTLPSTTAGPRATHRPAEGFEAQIEWSTPPHDRELLYSPPIKALWERSPAAFTGAIEVVIEVNSLGRVVSVFSPDVDSSGLTDAVQLGVLKYRFAPIEGAEAPERQLGSVRITRAGAGS